MKLIKSNDNEILIIESKCNFFIFEFGKICPNLDIRKTNEIVQPGKKIVQPVDQGNV